MATTIPPPPKAKPVRNYLAEVTTKTKPRPMAGLLYGPPGIGKSSLGAAIPGRIFMVDSREDGINTLKAAKLVDENIPVLPPIENWVQVIDTLVQLASQKHDYKALVIDTLGGLERLCHEHVCKRDFNNDWGERGFMSFQKGYDVSLAEWRLLLALLDNCRAAGMSILCLAHSSVTTIKNPEGPDYDRILPDLNKKTWGMTHKWCDFVLFANYFVTTVKESGRAKVRGGQERFLYTEYHAAYEAKNRSGLPAEIAMGDSGAEAWANFVKALKGGK